MGRKKNIYTITKVMECGRPLSASLRTTAQASNRPNPNATETDTPVYSQVVEYKLITCRFKDTNSGHQGSSLSFILNCAFQPPDTQLTLDRVRPLHLFVLESSIYFSSWLQA